MSFDDNYQSSDSEENHCIQYICELCLAKCKATECPKNAQIIIDEKPHIIRCCTNIRKHIVSHFSNIIVFTTDRLDPNKLPKTKIPFKRYENWNDVMEEYTKFPTQRSYCVAWCFKSENKDKIVSPRFPINFDGTALTDNKKYCYYWWSWNFEDMIYMLKTGDGDLFESPSRNDIGEICLPIIRHIKLDALHLEEISLRYTRKTEKLQKQLKRLLDRKSIFENSKKLKESLSENSNT